MLARDQRDKRQLAECLTYVQNAFSRLSMKGDAPSVAIVDTPNADEQGFLHIKT
jgi:hypothetical protein